ncbi:hypothetical protein CSA08_03150 [Candidatus Gracilibacteria bacterium]|nr:MAG: hypothetical protein CSA08_03150 [Candidatus Gracilibacteria bacterium]
MKNFEAPNVENIWKNRKGIEVTIPGVFEYTDSKGIKHTVYKSEDGTFSDIKGNNIDEEIDESLLNPKTEIVTRIDLLNFQGLNDEEIERLINNELFTEDEKKEGMSIDTEEGIRKINDIFKSGYDFLSDVGRKIPEKYNNFVMFGDKNELIEFCKTTQKSGTKDAYINCMLAKSASIVGDVLNNKELEYLKKKEEVLIYILSKKKEINLNGNKGTLEIYGKKIDFYISSRAKGKFSSMLKIGKDPMYYSSTIIEDGLGITFYIEDKEDSTIFLNYINDILFSKKEDDDIKIETKGDFIDIETNKWVKQIGYFIKKIIVKKPKDGTSEKYSDLKSKGKAYIPNSTDDYEKGFLGEGVNVEIKMVDFATKNDDGLSFHPVFGYFKYAEVLIRQLQGYISEAEIENIVNLFFYNLDDNLEEKNRLIPEGYEKTRKQYLIELEKDLVEEGCLSKRNKSRPAKESELREGLKKYYLSKLVKVKVGNKQEPFFTTEREYNLSLAGYRQKMEVIKN